MEPQDLITIRHQRRKQKIYAIEKKLQDEQWACEEYLSSDDEHVKIPSPTKKKCKLSSIDKYTAPSDPYSLNHMIGDLVRNDIGEFDDCMPLDSDEEAKEHYVCDMDFTISAEKPIDKYRRLYKGQTYAGMQKYKYKSPPKQVKNNPYASPSPKKRTKQSKDYSGK